MEANAINCMTLLVHLVVIFLINNYTPVFYLQISPTFSSGKMRKMHPIIVDCVHRLDKVLEKRAQNKEEIDLKKMMGNLTMDVIATCAFATKIDTHNEEKSSDFVIHAQKVFRSTWRIWVFFLIAPVFPQILKWAKFSFTDPTVAKFFRSAVGPKKMI